SSRSMVVDDFDFMAIAVPPEETDAPLVVDPDAVPAFAVAFQGFQAIRGRNTKIFQGRRSIEHAELAARDLLDIGRQLPGSHSAPDLLRLLVGKAPDHGVIITQYVI